MLVHNHTDEVLMIAPAAFGYNPETARTNPAMRDLGDVHAQAEAEFWGLVKVLEEAGILVHVVADTPEPPKPDAIFPNNWISFHGEVACLYTMLDPSRQHEVRPAIPTSLGRDVIDLRAELPGALEGTGSLVLERGSKTAFAAISPRTDSESVAIWCEKMSYRGVTFETRSNIYHTNVLMAIGHGVAVVCLDDCEDPLALKRELETCTEEVMPISKGQMDLFCGNILALKGIWAMSTCAHENFLGHQRRILESRAEIVHAPIPTIETVGYGSARCMICEVI